MILPPMILPPVVGHRGVAGHAPENTLAGIAMAKEMGLRAVELDVALTEDGVPVLFHDLTLERTSDGQGSVDAHRAEDLARRDAGSWFHPDFAGEPIPTLAAALAAIAEFDLGLCLEIKPQPGADEATAEAAVEALAAGWTRADPPAITSFSMIALAAARAAEPDLPRCANFAHGTVDDWLAAAEAQACTAIHVNRESLDPDSVGAIKTAGYACGAFTVNSFWEARRLADAGVDYIFTDTPGEVAEAFA